MLELLPQAGQEEQEQATRTHPRPGVDMKCARCQVDFPMPKIRFKEAGLVEGGHGMKKFDGMCHDCYRIVPIDDTSREPGSDDNKEEAWAF